MLKRFFKAQDGAVLVVSGAFMPVLIGISILMIDVSLAFSAKSRVEAVAVQTAEAAAHRLPDSASAIVWGEQLATDLLHSVSNYVSDPQIVVTSDGTEVVVDVSVVSRTFLAGIFGVNGLKVRAVATRS